jgi:hypothetical protein
LVVATNKAVGSAGADAIIGNDSVIGGSGVPRRCHSAAGDGRVPGEGARPRAIAPGALWGFESPRAVGPRSPPHLLIITH